MQTSTITDRKIITLLPSLTAKQKKVVLSVVETFVEDETDIWEDKGFVKEMDRRFAELESGKDKGITLEQLEFKARSTFKNKKAKAV